MECTKPLGNDFYPINLSNQKSKTMNKINWNKPNFLKSKKGNLIVVNCPTKSEDNFFEGVIINADESETNKVLTHSKTFNKNKFNLIDYQNIVFTTKNK